MRAWNRGGGLAGVGGAGRGVECLAVHAYSGRDLAGIAIVEVYRIEPLDAGRWRNRSLACASIPTRAGRHFAPPRPVRAAIQILGLSVSDDRRGAAVCSTAEPPTGARRPGWKCHFNSVARRHSRHDRRSIRCWPSRCSRSLPRYSRCRPSACRRRSRCAPARCPRQISPIADLFDDRGAPSCRAAAGVFSAWLDMGQIWPSQPASERPRHGLRPDRPAAADPRRGAEALRPLRRRLLAGARPRPRPSRTLSSPPWRRATGSASPCRRNMAAPVSASPRRRS